MKEINIFTPLNQIEPKLAPKLNKLGINRVCDILLHLPNNIEKSELVNSLEQEHMGKNIAINLKIIGHKKNYKTYKIFMEDYNQKILEINYFSFMNNKIMYSMFPLGEARVILGKLEQYEGKYSMNHPKKILKKENFTPNHLLEKKYDLTKGLQNKDIEKLIEKYLYLLKDLPKWQTEDDNMPTFANALLAIHKNTSPSTLNNKNPNKLSLIYNEFLSYNLALLQARGLKQKIKTTKLKPFTKELNFAIKQTGFTLTNAQIQAIKQINHDLCSGFAMNRLLQGDVGSGKTIVAFLSMLINFYNGLQSCLVVPTDILATQHYETFCKLLHTINPLCKIEVLKASLTASKQKEIAQKLKSGETHMLIATHSVFNEKVLFKNLGLLVIDEQHRFGVLQRGSVLEKSGNAHLLIMSATPIPRTMNLALYGEIDVSIMDEKPKGRKKIHTIAIHQNRIPELIKSLQNALKNNKKVFWVCPLIEESEKLSLVSVEDRFAELKKHTTEEDLYILHGKMKAKEKDEILENFKNAKKGILVATTVIEVGIDIRDSNIIIIEHAERFGLAQLHQLRGRVGRGNEEANCILIFATLSENTKKRIQAMKDFDDGFKLAEIDLQIRGGGNFIGTEQSGIPKFKIGNLYEDYDIFKKTIASAKYILEHGLFDKNLQTLIKIFSKENAKNIIKIS